MSESTRVRELRAVRPFTLQMEGGVNLVLDSERNIRDVTWVTDTLFDEIDSLRAQIATLTRERDDARAVLKAVGFEGERLALAHEAVAAGLTVKTHGVDNDEHYLNGVPLPVPGEWFGVSDGVLIRIFTERMWEPADGGDNDHYSFVNDAEFDGDTGKQTPNGLAYIERNKKKTWYETGSDAIAAFNAARGGNDE